MGSNLGLRDSKLGFWGEKWVLYDSSLSLLAMASDLLARRAASLVLRSLVLLGVTASLVLRSCVFFTYFCFELAFGVNMKVLDN